MTITYMVSLSQLQMKKEVIIISPYIRSQNHISHNQHLLVAYRSKTLKYVSRKLYLDPRFVKVFMEGKKRKP